MRLLSSAFIYTLSVNAEIVAIGSELLTPFRQDTNSLYLTERLNQLGVEVIFKTIVGDSREHLTGAATPGPFARRHRHLHGRTGTYRRRPHSRGGSRRARTCSCIAIPKLSPDLERRFASRGMKMSPNNLKQADVIAGAVVLPNANGSAPGQWVSGKYEGQEKIIMLLPGPPHEMKALFDEQCMDRLRAKLPPQFIATRVLKIGLMAESQADARVAPIYKRYTDVQTTILAGAGEIQLHLKTRAASLAAAQARVDQLAEEIEEELGDAVFSDNGDSLEQIVGYYLQMRDATLAVAESCTGGLAGGAHHVGQRQLPLLSGWGGGLFEPDEDSFRRCSRRR